MAKVAQSWAWDRHGHSQPGLLLLHGVLGMGEEDRGGCDHRVKCVLGGPEGSWELWKKEGIEQAGPRVSRVSRSGVSGQKSWTMGAAEMAGICPGKPAPAPQHSRMPARRFGLHCLIGVRRLSFPDSEKGVRLEKGDTVQCPVSPPKRS